MPPKGRILHPKRPRSRLHSYHKIIIALLCLFISIVLGLLLHIYGIEGITSLSDLIGSSTRNQEKANHEAILDKLNDDLDLAIKPFEGTEFPLYQIFGRKPIWGTLNSGHYFGLKLSSPQSIETSLMWFENRLNNEGRLDIRHLCNQNDRLDSYSWLEHDFHTFGRQIIDDRDYNIQTSFLKQESDSYGWVAKIDIDSRNATKTDYISLIQYITIDSTQDELSDPQLDFASNETIFSVSVSSKDLGRFHLNIELHPSSRGQLIKSSFFIGEINKLKVPIAHYLHSKMIVSSFGGQDIYLLPGSNRPHSRSQKKSSLPNNIVAYQLVLKPQASFFIKLSVERDETQVSTTDYDMKLSQRISEFDTKFSKIFDIKTVEAGPPSKLAKVALSNMIGSIGYFYGLSFIGSSSRAEKVSAYGPVQLLTGVPSRSFFPRGFLWDEGFHNLVISAWDPQLSNKIIKSWFELMNINGWIPREIILGIESMRRVPNEFIVQRLSNANPPAMFIVIEKMIDSKVLEQATLESIYPRLKAWHNWFNTTQAGQRPTTFRWQGRDELSVSMLNPKTLTSGLDDYPRASHPSKDEYHVDLRCWMALSSRTLLKLATIMNDEDYRETLVRDVAKLTDNSLLNGLHWSDDHQMYCDYGHNTENTKLVKVTKVRQSQYGDHMETYQVLERQSIGHPNFGCVPEFGYVSLFPMLFKILEPDSEKLLVILTRLRDPEQLWTDFGIRSISKSSKFYRKYNTEHDKPYWRGPIWVNMNYLVLSSLKYYSNVEGPYKKKFFEVHQELRSNLISNVLREFERTSYLWENYDDLDGRGQGSHPFTGWSSLIILILSERY